MAKSEMRARWLIGCLLVASGQAQAQDSPSRSTGSPSNVAATVSPVTVALAVDHSADPTRSVSVSLGTSYASGDFGSNADARISTTALGVRYATGRLRVTASMPYMRVRSNSLVLTGIDSTPVILSTQAPAGGRIRRDGLGDLTLGASYAIPVRQESTELEVSGRVKLPTASKGSGLSSRKTDYAGSVQLTRVVGKFAPFVSASYRILGDPSFADLRNGMAASAGTSVVIGDSTVLLASYHYAKTASRLVRDSHELFGGVSRQLGRQGPLLTGFVTGGLSSGSAAISSGVGLSFRF